MTKVSVKALVIGNIVDIVLCILTAIPLTLIGMNAASGSDGETDDQIRQALIDGVRNNYVLITIMPFIASFLPYRQDTLLPVLQSMMKY